MIDTSPRVGSTLLKRAGRLETEHAMVALTKPASVDSEGADRDETLSEARQLIADLRDAAQDGRHLARRYAEMLQNVVDEYCVEFEKRAEAALARLEAVQ
jgi:hypothetical protein